MQTQAPIIARSFVSLLLLSLVSAGLGQEVANAKNPQATAKSTPNIVVIMADDLGYGDLSCYRALAGTRRCLTPLRPRC